MTPPYKKTRGYKNRSFAGVLYWWWAFAQQPELGLIKDDRFPSDGANNASIFQTAHNPDRGLGSGPGHVGDFLPGEGEIGTQF